LLRRAQRHPHPRALPGGHDRDLSRVADRPRLPSERRGSEPCRSRPWSFVGRCRSEFRAEAYLVLSPCKYELLMTHGNVSHVVGPDGTHSEVRGSHREEGPRRFSCMPPPETALSVRGRRPVPHHRRSGSWSHTQRDVGLCNRVLRLVTISRPG